jgi:protein SCO1/2
MTPARPIWPIAALAAVAAVTACWWALALWPATAATPDWLMRTREVCFGRSPSGLPTAGGWILLVGQPLGMLIVLVAAWPAELRASLRMLMSRAAGQAVLGVTAAAVVAGIAGVVVRVSGAGLEPFSPGTGREIADRLTRVDDKAPVFDLVDQHGQPTALDRFRGRPVLVTFAFAHCETVCPTVVSDVLKASARLGDRAPAVLVFTLDPWRDTPARLPSVASLWRLPSNARVLSGEPAAVERVLNAWRVPRVRNTATGDLSHPALVYVIDGDGRIAYVLTGGADAITAAVRAL